MKPERPKQTVAQDLRDDLLRLLWQKFYAGDPGGDSVAAKAFAQDRTRLLAWVILWPAGWLNKKGLTLPADRYKKIFSDIILEAVRHGNTSKVQYRPAWLRYVIQSHFRIHGDDYYNEAKSARAQAEHALLMLGKLKVAPEPDPVRELAGAAALLTRTKPAKKAGPKQAANLEFNL
jgi:hypothetical protein